jgi:S-DNA-T family DNA segregation ATPase FtsK/SpoIIIE
MARKKKERRPNTLPDAIGINNFFQKDTVKFIIGVILAAVGILLLIALVSYLVTGGDDQSLVEHPNMMELGSIGNGAENQCGSMGALISYVLINKWFGFAAFLIPVYMIFAALDLMRAYQVNLLKWFICCAIVMMWGSVTCGEFLTHSSPTVLFLQAVCTACTYPTGCRVKWERLVSLPFSVLSPSYFSLI